MLRFIDCCWLCDDVEVIVCSPVDVVKVYVDMSSVCAAGQ